MADPIEIQKLCKKIRAVKRQLFTKQFNKCQASIDQDEGSSISKQKVEKLKETWNALGKAHEEVLLGMEEKDLLVDEYLDDMETEYEQIMETLDKVMSLADNKSGAHKAVTSDHSEIFKKRVSAPIYEGDICDYYVWKANFRNNFESKSKSVAMLQLLEALAEDQKRKIAHLLINGTIEDMFTELDNMYGDKRKISKKIMSRVHGIPPCKSNCIRDFRYLYETVKEALSQLGAIGCQSHLSHFNSVETLERKLPQEYKIRWAEIAISKDITMDNTFDKLMEFIQHSVLIGEQLDRMNEESESICGYQTQVVPGYNPQTREAMGRNRPSDNQGQCPLHDTVAYHPPSRCYVLKRVSKERKLAILRNELKDYCRICLKSGHGTSGENCKSTMACFRCGGRHFEFMHDSLEMLRTEDISPNKCYQMSGQEVLGTYWGSSICPAHYAIVKESTNAQGTRSSVLYDCGSNVSMIRNELARRLNLPVVDTKLLCFSTVSGERVRQIAPRYRFLITHPLDGARKYEITAFGVPQIGADFPILPNNMAIAANILGVKDMYDKGLAKRPIGPLDILIGTDFAECLPIPQKEPVGGLILAENDVGPVIFGSHESFRGAHPSHYRAMVLRTNQGLYATEDRIADFFSTESMGVEVTVKCGDCKCGKCAIGTDDLTMKEHHELELVKSSMRYDAEKKIFIVSYPLIKNPADLGNNFPMVLKSLEQLERDLRKQGMMGAFQYQFQEMIRKQIIRKLTPKEAEEWKGVVNYLPMQYVLKPESTSTPIRIVMDTVRKYRGKCIGDYWPKGPNLIKNSLGLLLRFREFHVAFYGDISKMYQTVHTCPATWHMHRLLWRDSDSSKEADIYVVLRNSFGSKPAGLVAAIALTMVAEIGKSEYPKGASCISSQMYVDDCVDSADTIEEAKDIMSQVDACLAIGSFTIKEWKSIGAPAQEEKVGERTLGKYTDIEVGHNDSVLGVQIRAEHDVFMFIPHLNLSGRKRRSKARQQPDLIRGQILDRNVVPGLTKRTVTSMIMTIYDPFGFLGPYMTELKFTMGKLWRHRLPSGAELGWDDELPKEFDERFRQVFDKMFDLSQVYFPRCLKPHDAIGKPWLVLCSDSSMIAFGAVAYIRWQRSDGSFWARIIASKSRTWPINPDDYISIVRGELQGAILAARLGQFIREESRLQFERSVYIVDSEIVRAQISTDAHAFDVFVGRRVAEIRKTTDPSQWFWISGKLNRSADLLTRGTMDMSLLGQTSDWQAGPAFIYQKFESWGVSQSLSGETKLTEMRRDHGSLSTRTMWCEVCDDVSWTDMGNSTHLTRTWMGNPPEPSVRGRQDRLVDMMDIGRFSDVQRLLGTTARLWHMVQWPPEKCSFRQWCKCISPDADSIDQAHIMWLRQAQKAVEPQIREKLRKMSPYQDEWGVWRGSGRFKLGEGYHPAILDNGHAYTRLLVTKIHRRGHAGAVATMAKVRVEYYVFNLYQLAAEIRRNCVTCRILDHPTVKVPMAKLPSSRTRSHFPFENVSVDVFGPFLLKVPGKVTRGRPMEAYGKGYGVMYTCLATRAVHIEAMEGADTQAFLMTLRRMMSVRGMPRTVWSDNGGQIVAADQELQDLIEGLDNEELVRFGAIEGIRWMYCAPGAPWQDGVTEALIKSAKRCLKSVLQRRSRIPIMELQTVFSETASLLNERPISLIGISRAPEMNESTYLCPNQLLVGRSTSRIPAGPFRPTPVTNEERFTIVENLVNEWWDKWSQDIRPTFLRQSKWFKEDRAVQVGDIVHVKDINPVRGDWKIAEVAGIRPSNDGHVRNVSIRYKVPGQMPGNVTSYRGVPSRMEVRDVKNLVVVVTKEERDECEAKV